MELYKQYDSSAMAFNPPIPPPKGADLNKTIKGRHYFVNEDVEEAGKIALIKPLAADGSILDFYNELRLNRNK